MKSSTAALNNCYAPRRELFGISIDIHQAPDEDRKGAEDSGSYSLDAAPTDSASETKK